MSSCSSHQGDLRVEETKRAKADDDGDDGGPLQPLKRRRNRAKMSCRPCQRRKTKCNKDTSGCEACIKRDEKALCSWDPPPSRQAPEPPSTDFIAQFNRMQRRLASLEQQVSSSGPAPQPASDQSSAAVLPPLPRLASLLPPTSQSAPEYSSSGFASFPSSTEPLTPPYDPSDAEAERAAHELENLALGRSQYGTLGRNTQLPCIGQMSTRTVARETPIALIPEAGRFTTILLSSKAPGRSVFARAQHQSTLLDYLPERAVSEALVEEFFSGDIGWIYNVLHKPTFVAETQELWDSVANGCASRIDPAWLATYYSVLAWAVSTLGPTRSKDVLRHYPDSEVKILPESWIAASEQALTAADWAGKPQVRVIQALFLKLALQREAPSSAPSLQSASSFYVYLSAAIRLAQLLGLHRLGSDPTKMPSPDPAFPLQECCLRRELAKRIWTQLCSFDLLFCSGASIGQCSPGSYDTEPPLNVDDEDLGLHLIAEERPPHYLTDLAFTRMKLVIGRHSATQQLGDADAAEPSAYERVKEMDAALQAEISIIQLTRQDSNPKRRPYHRALLLMILQNRVTRIHRPYFMRGFRDQRFQQSSSACLRASTAVCDGLQHLRSDDGNLEHLWWCWSYGLSAVFCLFMALLNEEGGGDGGKRELMLRARSFYVRGAQGDASSGVRDLSMQVVAVIDQLLLPRRRDPNNAGATSPAAAIFRTISHRLRSPNADGVPSSSSMSSSSNYSVQDFALPSPPLPLQSSAPDPSNFGDRDAELLNSSLLSPLSLNSFPQLPLLLPDALQQEPPLDFSFFDNLGTEDPPGALGFDVEAARETLNQFNNRPGLVMPSAAVLDDWQHLFNLVAPNGY